MDMTQQTHAWRFWGAWTLAFLSFPVAGVVGITVAGPVTTPLDGVLAGGASGAVLGLVQWLVLRHRLSLSPWWIAATAAGMGPGWRSASRWWAQRRRAWRCRCAGW
jgi:hypothetical protein